METNDPEGETKAEWRKTRRNKKPKKEKKLGKETLFIEKAGEESGEQLDSMNNEDDRGKTFIAGDFLQN